MSIEEKLTRDLAVNLSRRGFLKALGVFVTGLGLTLVGNVEKVKAGPACCPNPECSGCRNGGSNCPSGYERLLFAQCCLNYCYWTCSKCRKLYPPNQGTICYCSHEDFTTCPGGVCGNVPQP